MKNHSLNNSSQILAQIDDINARYHGVDISSCMQLAGAGIAKELIRKYGNEQSICFLCGKDNNGGNGFAAARNLLTSDYKGRITVYLLDKPENITSPAVQTHWQQLQNLKASYPNLEIHTQVKAAAIGNHKIICECLIGTGVSGKLSKKYQQVISRATHFRQKLVTIDTPVPGYNWHLSISTMYPKTDDAIVIDIKIPSQVTTEVGPGEVKSLSLPKIARILWLGTDENEVNPGHQALTKHFNINLVTSKLVDLAPKELESAHCVVLDLQRSNVGILGAVEKLFKLRGEKPVIITTKTAQILLESDVEDLSSTVLLIDAKNKYTSEMFGLPNPEGNILRWAISNKAYVIYSESRQDRIFGLGLDNKPAQKFVRSKNITSYSDYEVSLALSLSYLIHSNHPWLSASASSFLIGISTHLDNDLVTAWEKIQEF